MTLDKQVVMQILGSLMKQPSLLSEVENYSLIPTDFEETFERNIFMTIANLIRDGAKSIEVIDIDGYLAEKPHIYEIFKRYNGIEYLQDAYDLSTPDNFKYYYTQLKKYNIIKDLKNMGYDTNKIYPEKDMLTEDDYKKREEFDNITPEQIFGKIKSDLINVEAKYGCASAQSASASENIEELIKGLKDQPEIGMPCQGKILNTITRGARKGKFYLLSAMSGGSKTRTMVGNACYIAYPIRYNSAKGYWENTGSCEKVLYIGTEQVIEEIQTMILAYLTDLNEEIILSGEYTEEQSKLIKIAIKIMKTYDNFKITQLPEPNLQQVRTHLRQYCLTEGYEYVFYDYIFATPSLLNEFRDLAIRPDVALRMLSTLLKDLAVELDCFVMSATQITGTVEFKLGYIRNYMLLRDSKSIPDKADFAAIKAKVLPEELNLLKELVKIIGYVPNQVTDIYKMRRGRYVDVRIWSYADLGTCRFKDLFITDVNLNPLEDFEVKDILIDFDEEEQKRINQLLLEFNPEIIDMAARSAEVKQDDKEIETEEEIEPIEEKEITVKDWDDYF